MQRSLSSGGAAIELQFAGRGATRDIDVLIYRVSLDGVVQDMARERGWRADWLNDAVKIARGATSTYGGLSTEDIEERHCSAHARWATGRRQSTLESPNAEWVHGAVVGMGAPLELEEPPLASGPPSPSANCQRCSGSPGTSTVSVSMTVPAPSLKTTLLRRSVGRMGMTRAFESVGPARSMVAAAAVTTCPVSNVASAVATFGSTSSRTNRRGESVMFHDRITPVPTEPESGVSHWTIIAGRLAKSSTAQAVNFPGTVTFVLSCCVSGTVPACNAHGRPSSWPDATTGGGFCVSLAMSGKDGPDGGAIDVGVARLGAHEIELRIADHGIGIQPEELARVFGLFYRSPDRLARDVGGMGLGLFITKEIVDRHKGRIWADSEVGKGTTFHVALPAAVPAGVEA